MQAVIIAGGKGTRMGHLGKEIPKTLMPVAGKPLLKYQLDLLKHYGFSRVLILTNHLSVQIENYSKDYKGLIITCVKELNAVGTAGAVKLAQKYIKNDFLVIYGDVLVNMDLNRLVNFHRQQKAKRRELVGTLAVHPNSHPFDSDLVEADEDSRITNFLPKPHRPNQFYSNLVNAGAYILTPKIFPFIEKNRHADFGNNIFPKIIKRRGQLSAYNTPEYLKDMGTPQRIKEVEADIKSGKFKTGSLAFKKPAIFLDRDGTINNEVGDLRNIADFKLLPNVVKAIKKINLSRYYAVVITNQPVVAKGFCSYEDVLNIHKKMETLLGRDGAKLDGVYFCPHHPDKGFQGENKKYKIVCRCRKPKIGLIKRAVKYLNIDLKNSIFIGDTTRDAKTAENGKIKFIGVKTGYGLKDAGFLTAEKSVLDQDLLAAVNRVLTRK